MPQGTRIFVYDDAAKLIGEYDNLGRARVEHVWLEDRPIAAITYTYTGTSITPATTTTSYVETDHLATPRLITNASRQKRWTWESAPYGDTFPNENPQALGAYNYNLRFPGQYFDAETNHHYNHHRDYESTSGRYVESDPVGLGGGINTYAYVRGNPLVRLDPDGLKVELLCRPADLLAGLVDHCWLRTDTIEAGMNEQPSCSRAGNDAGGFPFVPVYVSDHSCDSPTRITPLPNTDETCVNQQLTIGRPLGIFAPVPPVNTCQTFAQTVINRCTTVNDVNRPYVGYPHVGKRR